VIQDGQGKGRLAPTGKIGAAIDVTYNISHKTVEPGGGRVAIIHSITCDSNNPLPMGDCDLLVGTDILRLRHTDDDPEWLVLSTSA
jgi:hypothetical protein